jgi:hypothetical protein
MVSPKAAAGLASAAEGEPQQCAMARRGRGEAPWWADAQAAWAGVAKALGYPGAERQSPQTGLLWGASRKFSGLLVGHRP